MIKTNIHSHYPHHLVNSVSTSRSLFVADYTNKTKSKRGTEIFVAPPTDISYFSLQNAVNLQIVGIPFDNRSFVCSAGNPLSQCECAVLPDTSDRESWILFAELKYSNIADNNEGNLNNAMEQLLKTCDYYKTNGVFLDTNTCYLIASLPMQAEPFPNAFLDPSYLMDMKEKQNIVIRFQNSATIVDDKQINV